MVKQFKLINDFYYCRPGKGALSSNTCFVNVTFVINVRVIVTLSAMCYYGVRVIGVYMSTFLL